jgi:hypothetical protein
MYTKINYIGFEVLRGKISSILSDVSLWLSVGSHAAFWKHISLPFSGFKIKPSKEAVGRLGSRWLLLSSSFLVWLMLQP